jgi:hypothetical protein
MDSGIRWQVLGALRPGLSVDQGMAAVDELRALSWHSMRIDLMQIEGEE